MQTHHMFLAWRCPRDESYINNYILSFCLFCLDCNYLDAWFRHAKVDETRKNNTQTSEQSQMNLIKNKIVNITNMQL